MKPGLLASVILFLTALSPAKAQAALDLADAAFVRVSEVAELAGILSDQESGAASLHDNDLDTVWHPPVGADSWIEFDLSTAREALQLELGSISIHWRERTSKKVTVYVGPDRFALYPAASSGVISTDALNIYMPAGYTATRYVRIEFQPGDFNVSEIEIKAADSKAAPQPVQKAAVKVDGHSLYISWNKVAAAHHYEIARNVGYEFVEDYYSTSLTFMYDRPQPFDHLAYKIRAVGYDGRSSEWTDISVSNEVIAAYNPASLDYPAIKGVVEGFYGQPWRHRTRLEILHKMSVWGMNTYLYGPKDDKKHRSAWRELYTEDELADFAELNEFADRRGINFVYGISPGNDIDPGDDDDFSELQAKLHSMYSVGIKHFALLMDDISAAKDGGTGAAHAAMTNRLYTWLRTLGPGVTLLFVPTVYSGAAEGLSDDESAYLAALSNINQAVPIAWTGQSTFDPQVTAAECGGIAALIGRKPLLWDNYPVNDFSLAQTLHLAAIEGRDGDTLRALSGLLVNPMVEGNASLFAIASYGELFDDPSAYDPETAWRRAALGLAGNISMTDWAGVVELFSTSEKLFPGRDELPELNELVEEFILAANLYKESEILRASRLLLDRLYFYYDVALKLEDGLLSSGLYDELYYRLQKLGIEAEGNILALNLILSDIYGVRDDFTEYEDRLEKLPAVSGWRYNVADTSFSKLPDELYEKQRNRRFSAYGRFEAIVARPMPNARVGQPYTCDFGFNMFSGCEWTLKADFDYSFNREGIMSFMPGRIGKERAMAVCRRDGTVVSFPFEIDVGPALNTLDEATLQPNSAIEEFGPVKALVQNGVIYPESGYSPMSKSRIRGPWKRLRAALDHRLSFAARSSDVVSRIEWESHGAIMPEYDDSDWDGVYMPQPENMLAAPYHPSGPEEYYGGVWYRVKTRLPSSAPGTRLAFMASSYIMDVWADGKYLGWHEGVYTPAYFELPDELLSKEEITLVVRIDHPSHGTYPDMLGPGTGADFFDYAGLVQDINWEYYPSGHKASINFVSVKPLSLSGKLKLDLILEESTGRNFVGRIKLEAFKTDPESDGYFDSSSPGSIARESTPMGGDKKLDIALSPQQTAGYSLEAIVNQAKSWHPWKPTVYILRVSLYETDGVDDKDEDDDKLIDRYVTQIGFRLLDFDKYGRMQLNNRVVFLPSFTYYEDRPFVGMQADWDAYKRDFQLMYAYGARMVHMGGYPHHNYVASIADRVGLAVMMEVPISQLNGDGLESLARRGVALQAWREMIFASYNRPSILFWGACDSCSSDGSQLYDFISVLHTDLDENYADGRLVTESAGAQDYFKGVKDSFAAVDIVGISSFYGAKYAASGQGIAASVYDLFYRISQDWPGKPVILTSFGAASGIMGDSYRQQNLVLNKTWDGIYEFLQVNDKRAMLDGPGIMAMSWCSMGDGFSNADGVRTYGAFGVDRYTRKPVADLLQAYYKPYEKNSLSGNDTDVVIPNKKDAQSCSQADGASGLILSLLLIALLLRRQPC